MATAAAVGASAALAEARYHLGADVGSVSTTSSDHSETDKRGIATAFHAGVALMGASGAKATLNLGLQRASVKGDDAGLDQEVVSNSLLLDGDYRFRLGGFQIGPVLRFDLGENAFIRARDIDSEKSRGTVNAGVRLGWEVTDGVDLLATLTRDLNVPKQVNQFMTLGVQFRLGRFSHQGETPPPAPQAQPVEPQPAPAVPSPAAAEPPAAAEKAVVIFRFRPDVFQFQLNSDALVPASQGNAEKIARILAANQANWKHVEIAGHADALGDKGKNKKLSEARAKAIFTAFARHGIASELMTAKGYGDEEPLPGSDPKSPENRRVEIRLTGVVDAAKLRVDLQAHLVPEP